MRPRLTTLLALGFAFATALPVSAATPQSEKRSNPVIGSTVFNWDDLKVRTTPNGERRDVANNATATLSVFECHITTLNPGRSSHEPHRHSQEELILVKDGTVEVHINGKTRVAGPGSVFFYASNDAHAVRNVGESRATYWVINLATPVTHTPAAHNKSPTRTSAVFDWAKLPMQTTKTGERRDVLKGSTITMESLTCHATTVNPGDASHGAHRHVDDEIVIVKEGTMEATINGRSQRAGTGSVLFFASNDLHGMRNAGDTRLTYYVIRMITTATPKAPAAAKK
jgi:quercetin dioxygenase-like cupin family protein